jgi:hypothetical protein
MPKIGEIRKGTETGYKSECKRIWLACEKCGKPRWTEYIVRKHQPRNKICALCQSKVAAKKRDFNGENNPRWNNGMRTDRDGYVFLYRPAHPKADSNGYVRRSWLILEEFLGRSILKGAIVHHVNGIKNDDRPENLQELFPSRHQTLSEEHKMKLSKTLQLAGKYRRNGISKPEAMTQAWKIVKTNGLPDRS